MLVRHPQLIQAAETGIQRTRKRLASRYKGSPPPSPVPVVLFTSLLIFYKRLDNLLHVSNINEHVLGFEIRVYNTAIPMEVIQAEQHLFRYLFHKWHRNTTVIPSFYQAKEVLSQHLKHHAYVHSVDSLMLEGIEKTDNVSATRMIGIRLYNFVQELDFVDRRLCVMRR